MSKLTVAFGVALVFLGGFSFMTTGSHASIAFLPAVVGLLLAVFGLLATTDDAKKRMLFMHIAVTVGLLGFLATVKSVVDYIQMKVQGRQFANPSAVTVSAATAALLLLFVLLCVRSFINARRSRA